MTVACKTIDLYNVPSGKTITNDIEAEHKKRDWEAAAAEAESRGVDFIDPEGKPDKIISDARVPGFIIPGAKFADSGDSTTPFQNLALFNDKNLEALKKVEEEADALIRELESSDLSPEQLESLKEDLVFDIGGTVDLSVFEGFIENVGETERKITAALDRKNFFQLQNVNCSEEAYNAKIEELYDLGIKMLVALETPLEGASWEDINKASKSKAAAEALAGELKGKAEERAEAEEAVAEASKSEVSFKEQCIMLATVFQLAPLHSLSFQNKKLPFVGGYEYNANLPVHGEPFGFINKLTLSPSMRNFFVAENDQLAHLQPMIRLFKVAPDSKGKEVEIEFPFDTFASKEDVSEIYNNKRRRGFGANIKNFTFAYDGSNPFSVKKSIKAKLSIKANNFSELLRERTSSGLRYVDLALKTGKAIKEKTGDPELDFRIKALIGLSLPNKGGSIRDYASIKGAINDNFVTLNLTPVTHEFNFDETGAVEFTIEYYAYIEEFFDKPRMNIFSDPVINKRVIERELAFKTLAKECGGDNAEKISKFKESESSKIKSDKLESLRFLTSKMISNRIIYYLNLTIDEFNELAKKGPFFKLGDLTSKVSKNSSAASTIAADLEEAYEELKKTEEEEIGYFDEEGTGISGAASDAWEAFKNSWWESGLVYHGDTSSPARKVSPQNKTIPYFYLGDLIDLILKEMQTNFESLNISNSFSMEEGNVAINSKMVEEERIKIANSIEQLKKMRIVLGPMEIVNHADTNQVYNISFADLPISLSYFNEWLTDKMIAKDTAEYTLTQFLNNLMNNLVKTFLNDDSCYDFNIKQKVRVFQSTITSYRQADQGDVDDITKQMDMNVRRLNIDKARRPVLNISGHRSLASPNLGAGRENHFFIYYAGRVTPKDLMRGDVNVDEDKGIYHYVMGRDRGIVKNISLSKTDSPGLKEVRFEQEGYQGLTQLREIYDVNIDSFLNVQAFPGTYLYVEPRGFSPDLGAYNINEFDLTDLGIGGYHMIIGSEHEIGPGVMKTSLKAKWVQGLDADNEQETESNSSGPKKCRAIY